LASVVTGVASCWRRSCRPSCRWCPTRPLRRRWCWSGS
jgi:hypothetical protein